METLLVASRQARDLGAVDLLVRAVLANTRGIISQAEAVDEPRVEMLESARELMEGRGDSSDLANILGLLGLEISYQDQPRSGQLLDQAIDTARRAGDPATLAHVLALGAGGRLSPEHLRWRLEASLEAVTIAATLHDPALRWHSSSGRYLALLESADIDRADEHLAIMSDVAESTGHSFFVWYTTYLRSTRALLAGRLAEAEAFAAEALEIGTRTGQPDALIYYGAVLFELRQQQGRVDELVDVIASTAGAVPGMQAPLRAALGSAYCALGRESAARQLFAVDAADGFASVAMDAVWFITMVKYAEVAAYLRDQHAASRLAELLAPLAGRWAMAGPQCVGPLDFYRGLLAATLGDAAQAAALLEAAHATATRARAAVWIAHAGLELAVALRACGDEAGSRARLHESLADARACGSGLLVQRALALLSGEGAAT